MQAAAASVPEVLHEEGAWTINHEATDEVAATSMLLNTYLIPAACRRLTVAVGYASCSVSMAHLLPNTHVASG
jgi:hypothetical protein